MANGKVAVFIAVGGNLLSYAFAEADITAAG